MISFVFDVIVEGAIVYVGAFLIALVTGRKRTVREVMAQNEVLSLIAGVSGWVGVAMAIKFALTGCVFCD